MATPEPNDVKHIEVIARGLIIANNALLLCRNVAGGYWYLPGGHVEPGESAAEALSRELVEGRTSGAASNGVSRSMSTVLSKGRSAGMNTTLCSTWNG